MMRHGAFFRRADDRVRLEISGRDAAPFLHNMTTNDVRSLQTGQGCPAALVNQRGQVLDHVGVYRVEEHFWVVGGPKQAEADLAWLGRYIITEDVELSNLAQRSTMLWLTGGQAAELLEGLAPETAGLTAFGSRLARVGGLQVRVLGTHGVFGPGYWIVGPDGSEDALAMALAAAGATEVDAATWDALRIEWGLPEGGTELTETRNPWEARLDGSVSLAKGCYLGQEIVARLNAYEKVQRYLVGLTGPGAPPAQGTALLAEGKPVGEVTSAAATPEGFVALAYVKAAFAAPGTPLTLDGREAPLAVEDRPFWAGRTRPVAPPSRA